MASLTFRPEKLTGGCLCGAIRYTIDITPETEWPPVNVSVLIQLHVLGSLLMSTEWKLPMYILS